MVFASNTALFGHPTARHASVSACVIWSGSRVSLRAYWKMGRRRGWIGAELTFSASNATSPSSTLHMRAADSKDSWQKGQFSRVDTYEPIRYFSPMMNEPSMSMTEWAYASRGPIVSG